MEISEPTWYPGKVIWAEDDVPYVDKEKIKQAWKRLFNEELDIKNNAIESIDEGDCIYYLMNNGYVATIAPHCDIREVENG